ncbi:MAG: radical SAM protein, partial [Clostridia bacterium]|nr:radical SAM protein [Clostridia bacterium]
MYCNDCPRKCNAYRDTKRGKGFCKSGIYPVVAKAYLHKWEEPCISGQNGAGNIFFCGCNLKCCYCQNKEISGISSQDTHCGRQITPERLSEIYDELIKKGAHCINLVTPTHYSAGILKSLELHGKLSVPLVYNCSGYETEESLKLFDNKVDIYMPDMKYGINSVAEKYSNAYDYPEIAKNAIREMFRQTGPYEYDESGMLKKGVIIRHLMLPGNLRNTFSVIDWVNETFKTGDILFS